MMVCPHSRTKVDQKPKKSRKIFKKLSKRNQKYENIKHLLSILEKMNKRIEKLEEENVGLTNALYEIENRLEKRINNINPVIYNLINKDNKS